MRKAWKGFKTLAGHTKPKLNSSNKLGDKQKEHSADELKCTVGGRIDAQCMSVCMEKGFATLWVNAMMMTAFSIALFSALEQTLCARM